jgi:acyl carrier protein
MYDETSARVDPRYSRGQVLDVVVGYVAQQVGMDPQAVAESDKLIADISCDSLDIAEIAMKLEERYQVTMPDEYFEQDRSVGEIADYLLQLLAR